MGQAQIMNLLDKHKGVYFTAREIHSKVYGLRGMPGEVSKTNRALKQIVKRNEYIVKMIVSDKVGRGNNMIALYGARENGDVSN